MFCYIALAWDIDDPNQSTAARFLLDRLQARGRARARTWGRIEQHGGLCVLHPNFRQGALDVRALPEQRGVLIGSVFERQNERNDDSAAPDFVPSREQSEQIVGSRGRWLVENAWGNYVAVLRDRGPRRTWVLKDPTGNLPCLRTTFRGVQVVFGNIADLVDTGLFHFTISERYLRDRTLHGGVLDHDALNEVRTIRRGECVELNDREPGRQHMFHWHPLTFVDPSNAVEDPHVAARAMRATLRSCTRTLCRDHESVLHRLSGGLDSSIVAACLADLAPLASVNCYTYFVPGGRSDERPWARLAAGRHDLNHEEHAAIPEQIPLPEVLDQPAMVEPTASLGYLLRSTLERQVAQEHRATAVFCGDGGDSGFCGDTVAYAVSEYLQRRGLGLQAFRLASGVAALTEESAWTVMMKSFRRWRRGAGMEHQRKVLSSASRLLHDELRASFPTASTFPHPWFNETQPIPWALVRRLGALLGPPEFYNVANNAHAPEVIAPLYSQPVVELLLSIPLDVHFHGARERGLARHAFAQDVPKEILRRNWKDRVPGFVDQLVDRHRTFLRELLLDGILVQSRLLDRAAVEEALSDRMTTSRIYPGELLRHLDVEVWARAWRSCASANLRSQVLA